MALIRIEHLDKAYDTPAGPLPVLHSLSFKLNPGEYVAVMGPSGSGKSTFMNILGCLDVPTAGHYWFEQDEVGRLGPNALAALRRDRIGFVFQGFNLLPRATLEDNVALPLVYRGISLHERRQKAREMLERMGLGRHLHSLPSQCSGGQQQRAAIARALINQPRLILADEPTGNLDSHTGEEIMRLFDELNASGVTLVVVTHELDIAAHAKRQLRFRDGVIEHDGPTR
jgi:putative ABC transport system ATP-binding protein